jgi:hypothetical protein
MASLLAVATVFVGLWTLNIYILWSEKGGVIRETKLPTCMYIVNHSCGAGCGTGTIEWAGLIKSGRGLKKSRARATQLYLTTPPY